MTLPRVVDCACYCDKCERRTKEFYALQATCLNCGSEFVCKMRKGDKRPYMGAECPVCGVRSTSWGGLAVVPKSSTEASSS